MSETFREPEMWFHAPPRPTRIPLPPAVEVKPEVEITVDGQVVRVSAGSTLLQACQSRGIDTPTICFHPNLTPVNVCRVCVVELEGSRILVPSCSRTVEPGMVVRTDSPRVRTSRRMVLEFLSSSVDLSTAPELQSRCQEYGAKPERYGQPEPEHAPGERDGRAAGHHHAPASGIAQRVAQPVKMDNSLYVRDYSKCVLCYKCVQACGDEAQNTFAIAVAGRGFDARISTENAAPLTESACVYCGNCIAVCPTGALMFHSEHTMREEGTWDENKQSKTDTICGYCGVGCTLTLHVQDNTIVKVTSPSDQEITHGNLCIKGRFGFESVQNREIS